jgi:hypothetical protein
MAQYVPQTFDWGGGQGQVRAWLEAVALEAQKVRLTPGGVSREERQLRMFRLWNRSGTGRLTEGEVSEGYSVLLACLHHAGADHGLLTPPSFVANFFELAQMVRNEEPALERNSAGGVGGGGGVGRAVSVELYSRMVEKFPVFFRTLGKSLSVPFYVRPALAPPSLPQVVIPAPLVGRLQSYIASGLDEVPSPGKGSREPVHYHDVQYFPTVISIMVGIKKSLDIFHAHLCQDDQFTDCKFTETTTLELPARRHASNGMVCPLFTDYAPYVFHKLRLMRGITDESYLLSLGPVQLLGSLVLGEVTSFSVKRSDGKSGSNFFSTHDGRFMIKNISNNERNTLLRILESLYRHYTENPNSLINPILGFFDIDGVAYVVLANVFLTNTTIHEIYDLKGSKAGRLKKEEESILKDLDIEQSGKKICLHPDYAGLFLNQLHRDTKVLV